MNEMRKIEQQMIKAVRGALVGGKAWLGGNTMVTATATANGYTAEVRLHDHHIACITVRDGIWAVDMTFTLAGWNTRTTRSRINALLDAFGPRGARVFTRR